MVHGDREVCKKMMLVMLVMKLLLPKLVMVNWGRNLLMSHKLHHKFATREWQSSRGYSCNGYILLTDGGESKCHDEACECDHKRLWLKAILEKMNFLHADHKYDLIKLPNGKKALQNKWVFHLKYEENNLHIRYKT